MEFPCEAAIFQPSCSVFTNKATFTVLSLLNCWRSAFTLGRMSLDKSLHMRLKTLLATLFNGSVHTSHMWSDRPRQALKNVHSVSKNVSKNVLVLLNETVYSQTHVNAHFRHKV